jgi:hypothetical protein
MNLISLSVVPLKAEFNDFDDSYNMYNVTIYALGDDGNVYRKEGTFWQDIDELENKWFIAQGGGLFRPEKEIPKEEELMVEEPVSDDLLDKEEPEAG